MEHVKSSLNQSHHLELFMCSFVLLFSRICGAQLIVQARSVTEVSDPFTFSTPWLEHVNIIPFQE